MAILRGLRKTPAKEKFIECEDCTYYEEHTEVAYEEDNVNFVSINTGCRFGEWAEHYFKYPLQPLIFFSEGERPTKRCNYVE